MTRGGWFGIAALLGGCGFDSSGSTGTGASVGGDTSTTADEGDEPATTSSASASADATSGTEGEDVDSSGASTESGSGESSSTGPGDPCALDNGGCDEDATCSVDDEGKVECDCDDGFEGDGSDCTVVPVLETLRWELPCQDDLGATCSTDSAAVDAAVMVGEPGAVYDVELRLRGVLERKAYIGGAADGFWYVGGDPIPDGGWNSTALVISDPPQLYRYNNGPGSQWDCVLVDVTRTVQIAAGAEVSIAVDTENDLIIDNDSGIVVPDVEPAPAVFDGQFAQLDAVSIQR